MRHSLAALLLAASILAVPAAPGAFAQSDAAAPPARAAVRPAPDNPSELPPPSVTRHRLKLPDGELAFTATAGATRLHDDGGTPIADFVLTSYRLDGADPARRPVAFVVNGGPGAASAWLQLGALGPWRLVLDGAAAPPSTPPRLVDNAETWLAFTDLVFIDPPGTGYSRLVGSGDDIRRRAYSVDGDIDFLAAIIRRWTEDNRRELSPKVFVGESYGGFRGPLVARALATDHGIGLKGLVLVSPVLDFRLRDSRNIQAEAALLPSMVAAARRLDPALAGPPIAEIERIAASEHLADLARGPRDEAARGRIVDRVAAWTGLDRALVAQYGGRLPLNVFLNHVDRRGGRFGSPYDAAAVGLDPNPFGESHGALDPVLDALKAPFTSAARELYAGKLDWAPKRRYEVLSNGVNRAWDWGRSLSPPQSSGALADMLAADPTLGTVVVHGSADLVTPYMASRFAMDQIAVPGVGDRLQLRVLAGGHMFYADPASRIAFRDIGRDLVAGAAR